MKIKKGLNRTSLRVLAAFILIVAFSLGVTYFWRVAYEPAFPAKPLMLFTTIGIGTFVVLTALIAYFCREKENLRTVLLIALIGIVFALILPPLQAPDETAHFVRSYAISKGHFNFDMSRQYSDELGPLFKAFPMAFYNGFDQTIAPQFHEYFRLAAEPSYFYVGETLYLLVWPYIPQAMGIFLARAVGFGALGQLYAARIFNVLLYAALCYPALKNCTRYRGIMQAIMLLPVSLQIVAGNSYDSWLLGSMLLTFSYFGKEEINRKDLPFMLLSLLPCSIKPPQVLTAIVWLFIPEKRWNVTTKKGEKIKKWQIALLAAAGMAVCCVLYEAVSLLARMRLHNCGAIERWNPDVGTSGQIGFMLHNPIRTIAVFFFTLYENEFFITGLGKFCNLDIFIPVIAYLSVLTLLLAAFFDSEHTEPDKKHRKKSILLLAVFGVVYVGIIMAALYVTWTPVGMIRVVGLQSRYFLPSVFAFFIAISCAFSGVFRTESIDKVKLGWVKFLVPYTVSALSALLLFQHCFIGPFAH